MCMCDFVTIPDVSTWYSVGWWAKDGYGSPFQERFVPRTYSTSGYDDLSRFGL